MRTRRRNILTRWSLIEPRSDDDPEASRIESGERGDSDGRRTGAVPVRLPALLIVAGAANAASLSELFCRRGFTTRVAASSDGVRRFAANRTNLTSAAIIDFAVPSAFEALRQLDDMRPRPALIGVVDPGDVAMAQHILDGAFARPVQPAQVFARVVELVENRRTGARPRRVIARGSGVVRGNHLYQRAVYRLSEVVPPACAGAALDEALHDLGVTPLAVTSADLAAIAASGRLTESLIPFAEPAVLQRVLAELERLAHQPLIGPCAK